MLKRILKNILISKINKLMSEHLNINSLRNKFNNLSELVKGSIDIFMVSAIALDDNFHSPIRSNRNKNDGGIILYVQKDIHVKLLSHDFPSTESYFVEIKLYKKKWLIKCLHKSNIRNHLDIIITSLDTHTLPNMTILLFLVSLMHVMMTRLCRVLQNLLI